MTLPYHVLHPTASPVIRSDGVEYRSIAEATKATGACRGAISAAAMKTLKGKFATYMGFQWAHLTGRKVNWPTKHSSKRRDQLKEAETRPVLRSDGAILPCLRRVAELNHCTMSDVRQAIKATNRMECREINSFQWAWADKPPQFWPIRAKRIPPSCFRKPRPVIRSDGVTFSSIIEASEATLVAVSNISSAATATARGFCRRAGGYQFAYVKPDVWPVRRRRKTLLRSVIRTDGLQIDSLIEAAVMLSCEPECLINGLDTGVPIDDFTWSWAC